MEVKGFNHCKMFTDGIAFWENDYPKHGVNFKLWDQVTKKGDRTCSNGIYNEQADACFTYTYIKQICLLVKFKRDRQTNTYSWIYTGGCFEGGKPVLYKEAVVGEVQNFKTIQFEVRMDNRFDADLAYEEEEEYLGEEIEDENGVKIETTAQKIKKEKIKLNEAAKAGEIQN